MLRLFHNEACQTGSYTLEMHILLIKLREKVPVLLVGFLLSMLSYYTSPSI